MQRRLPYADFLNQTHPSSNRENLLISLLAFEKLFIILFSFYANRFASLISECSSKRRRSSSATYRLWLWFVYTFPRPLPSSGSSLFLVFLQSNTWILELFSNFFEFKELFNSTAKLVAPDRELTVHLHFGDHRWSTRWTMPLPTFTARTASFSCSICKMEFTAKGSRDAHVILTHSKVVGREVCFRGAPLLKLVVLHLATGFNLFLSHRTRATLSSNSETSATRSLITFRISIHIRRLRRYCC